MVTLPESQVLERADQWILKAKQEPDQFNRFMSFWVAYNMIYGIYTKRVKPKESITWFDREKAIRTTILLKDSCHLKSDLVHLASELYDRTSVFREEYWKRNDTTSLRQHLISSLRNDNFEYTLETILKILYKIRCNLFHGEKSYYDYNQRQLLEVCNVILDKILQETIRLFKLTFLD